MDNPAPPNPRPAPSREQFHQEFFRRAQQFAQDMITLVPELESVAITPSWEISQDRLPYGIIMGRNGPIRSPQEVVHMAEQLHGTLKTVMDASYATLKKIDEQMGEMAGEINVRQQRLAALDQELGEAGPEGDAASRATPESPGPS